MPERIERLSHLACDYLKTDKSLIPDVGELPANMD